ncbi:MAG: hypothetical protein AAGE85_06030 [Pseudomonadota bacterium]
MNRRNKNLALCAANALLFVILLWKTRAYPDSVRGALLVWMFVAPFILAAAAFDKRLSGRSGVLDMLLFLTTGTAIGLTLGGALSRFDATSAAEIAWLPFGLSAAILHYWPSRQDEYRQGR